MSQGQTINGKTASGQSVAVRVDENGYLMVSGGGGGASVWGSITGVLSNQADLQAALNAKASSTTNTGDQALSIAGTALTISGPNGNTVTLPSGGSVDETNLVHKTGDETVYGNKEFKNDIEIEGQLTMGGDVILDGTDVIINPGGSLMGYINTTNAVQMFPVFTDGDEKGWKMSGLYITSGRFDVDQFQNKVEFRIHGGSSTFTVYNTDTGNMLRVNSNKTLDLFNNLQMNNNEVTGVASITMKSPNGTNWRVTVDDTGHLVTTTA